MTRRLSASESLLRWPGVQAWRKRRLSPIAYGVPMGLRPTHSDESACLRFIDSKQVTRDFRGSTMTSTLQHAQIGDPRTHCVTILVGHHAG
jgi:hypothetical protein